MHLQFENLPIPPMSLGRIVSAIMDIACLRRHSVIVDKRSKRQSEEHTPEELVDLAIKHNIARIAKRSVVGGDESFFVADLGYVVRQHQRWSRGFPDIQPYYAVKCNSDPTLLKLLADLGTGFDCASIEEISAVLNLGVDPARILFANPCKAPRALEYARKTGVPRTTFDNLDELEKIKKYMPTAQLFLRIWANDDNALICLSEKFGARLDSTRQLLSRAWELDLNVIGVSFHVGTGAKSPSAFARAIKHARIAFAQAENLGFTPRVLDIGGGFQDNDFESTAHLIRDAILSNFPDEVTVIAEPGRFYGRGAYALVSRVISRRKQLGGAAAAGEPAMLYQSDGVYGNFMNVIMEKERMCPQLVLSKKTVEKNEKQYRYSIWGPTCDSIDCVVLEAMFECEVQVGDWLKYENMGAYTTTTSTRFNGFNSAHEVLYVNSETWTGQLPP